MTGEQEWIETLEREIAMLRRRVAELETSEERYRGLVETQHDLVVRVDPEGRFTFVNEAYCTMFGKTREELLSATFMPSIHEEDLPATLKAMEALETPPYRVSIEQRALTADGWRWLAWDDYAIKDENGTTVEIQGVGRDITSRKQAEETLRENEERYRNMVENATIGIFRTSLEGKILEANPTTVRMLGYDSPQELITKVASVATDIYTSSTQREALMTQMREREGKAQMEVHLRRRDGDVIAANLHIWAVRDRQGNIKWLEGFMEDVTEQKRQKEAQAFFQQQIIEAQQAALRELSTPLLPLADHVIALPLIGTMDEERTQQVMEALLEGIAYFQADIAILDITGIRVVDTQVAQALVRTAQAVKLLGAQVVLTGIQPQIAQTLVHLGADLEGIITRSTLQSGIAFALHRQA
ncbi:MAG: PAS domain S-box protein [Chloroflexaceae bacterium]|nr:PAS domain S-box protein [Chloroflexaceae bacterium]